MTFKGNTLISCTSYNQDLFIPATKKCKITTEKY